MKRDEFSTDYYIHARVYVLRKINTNQLCLFENSLSYHISISKNMIEYLAAS